MSEFIKYSNNNSTDLKMPPTVTIAIPTYNRANSYLRSAVECALAQSWHGLEIIISDNCSTDNTAEIVESYSDPRLTYVRQERNIGANNNFNFCVDNARGDYFLLFHDDDLIDSDIVSTCMEAVAGNTSYGLIRTGTRLIDDSNRVIREIPNHAGGLGYNEFFRGWMRNQFTSYVCSTFFNTRLLREVGGFKSRHGLFQDLMVVAKLTSRGGRFDVEDVKASFRRHDENYGNAAELKAWCEDGRELADTIASEAPEEGEALHRESMLYLCRTVYGYADRFLSGRAERIRAYRIIDAEFNHCYPMHKHLLDKLLPSHLRNLRKKVRSIRGTFSRQSRKQRSSQMDGNVEE